jgi:hypothetical protein
MPLDSTLYLYLKLTAGGDVDPYGVTGQVITIELTEFNFCPWNIYQLAGMYSGITEYGYYADYTTDIEITIPAGQAGPVYKMGMRGLWETAPGTIWGEVYTDMVDSIVCSVNATDKVFPVVSITNQYLGTTDDEWEYWIATYKTYSQILYCEKAFYLVYCIPYAGDVASLVDIVEVVFDYETKTARTNYTSTFHYDPIQLYKKQ